MIVLGGKKASIFRTWQNRCLREFCDGLAPTSVLNLGAEPEAADKEGRRYRDYFPDARFRTLDTRPHDHPDYIQGDLTRPSAGVGPFDLVLCMSVIEHIDRPWAAAPVITDLVAPGGHLYVAMPWFYPTHEGEDYGDHWRARPSGLRLLFDRMAVVREAAMPSPVAVVRDRRKWWRKPDAAAAGFCLLLRRTA